MRMTNISKVLGRMREIEAMINPAPPREEPAARFEDVLEETLDDPYAEDGGFAPLEDIVVPESVAERLAMWEPDLQELSGKYGVDPDLARAVMRMESGGNPNALSSAGAIGLMQLMPGTAKGLGVNPKDPKRNLEGGIKYLAQLADKYDGDYVKTLAAYNAGSGRVDSYGGVPPFPETERYVKNVLALYRKYSRGD
ncbi:MAG: lytic transglycosylase domain-containing protein [Synergistaceae bacterium]|jgi:soluble lytic murein transglycosylase-like protein|nr:lytic transglycosylase domain-containing protein [Synergistaceae bacterium]